MSREIPREDAGVTLTIATSREGSAGLTSLAPHWSWMCVGRASRLSRLLLLFESTKAVPRLSCRWLWLI